LTRYEPLDADTLARLTAGLRLAPDEVLDSSWLVNGPTWIGLRLASAERVLAVRPDYPAVGGYFVGVVGPWADGAPGAHHGAGPDVEVRAFVGAGYEDPVTGSFNAGVARWLVDTGRAPSTYVAAQGTVLQRAGRVHIEAADGEIWVGGDTTTLVEGTVVL
jgi:predicted PhzF superfamily epimerase YddE/YHI9